DYNVSRFHTLSGGLWQPQILVGELPQTCRSQFSDMMKNLQLLQSNIWLIYKADIILAVAFHAYLEEYTSTDKIVKETDGIGYEPKEYLNLPISLEIKAEKSITKYYFVDMKLCNGILNKITKGQNKTINLFKKSEKEYEKDGNFKGKKDWAVEYGNLKEEINDIVKSNLSIEDVWFLKNVFDPELIAAMGQVFSARINKDDYELLYIISKCKCPSVRIYLVEAVAPYYRYLKKNIRPLRENLDDFFCVLQENVEKIQAIYESLTIFTAECIKQAGLDFAAIREGSSGVMNKFYGGNDFPFLYNERSVKHVKIGESNGFYQCDGKQLKAICKENQDTGGQKKSYADYIAETPNKSRRWKQIAYGVITALNESWDSDTNFKMKYETPADFQFALLQHIQGDI
ncbi:MAG: hypothetical protein LUH04_14965, partial [Clostridium sp.]|nr:hypothetical protein [Clostridium sp.]